MNKQAGFTIFELLTVIAIIGILAGLIIANVSSARRVARDRRRVGDVQIIQGAIQAFWKDKDVETGTGRYPDPSIGPCGLGELVPTHLQSVPMDPQGACYSYVRNPCASAAYIVAARLETTGIRDAAADPACWSGDSPDNQVYVVTGR